MSTSDEHRGVRLMNDYAARWPLWWEEGGQLERSDLVLSDALVADILAWVAGFQEKFDHETGWPSADERLAHAARAHELAERLRAEVPAGLQVRLDLWEA